MPTLNWNSLRGKPEDVRAIFDYTGRGKPLAVPVFDLKGQPWLTMTSK